MSIITTEETTQSTERLLVTTGTLYFKSHIHQHAWGPSFDPNTNQINGLSDLHFNSHLCSTDPPNSIASTKSGANTDGVRQKFGFIREKQGWNW